MKKKTILMTCLFVICFVFGAKSQVYVDVDYNDLSSEIQQKIDENKLQGLNYFTGIVVSFDVELRNLQGDDVALFKTKLESDSRVKSYTLSDDARHLSLSARGDYTIKDIAACAYDTAGWPETYSKTFSLE